MSYGYRQLGSHGYVQIDQNYQNLFLKAKGNANIPSSSNQGLGSLVAVTLPITLSPTSVIALSGAAVAVVNATSGGNIIQIYSPYADGRAFTWWVFDKLTSVSSSGFGMIVRKPVTFEPIYDDTQKPMRVLGQFAVPSPGFSFGLHGTTAYGTSSFSGKTTAAVNMNLPSTTWSGGNIGQGTVPNYYYIACPQATNNTVTGVTGLFTTFGGAADVSMGTNGNVLVLDVTGY